MGAVTATATMESSVASLNNIVKDMEIKAIDELGVHCTCIREDWKNASGSITGRRKVEETDSDNHPHKPGWITVAKKYLDEDGFGIDPEWVHSFHFHSELPQSIATFEIWRMYTDELEKHREVTCAKACVRISKDDERHHDVAPKARGHEHKRGARSVNEEKETPHSIAFNIGLQSSFLSIIFMHLPIVLGTSTNSGK
ncbi:hypothetical protein B0H19DRAFT_1072835 [Mycena capillaripes]|nr:hypothetical protein B0H19DRAFT_1072835 [Mycena capillaripes]